MATDRFTGDSNDETWAAWYALSMQERWDISMQLWQVYLGAGGSLAPDRDPQNSFCCEDDTDFAPVDGQPDMTAAWRELMKNRRILTDGDPSTRPSS